MGIERSRLCDFADEVPERGRKTVWSVVVVRVMRERARRFRTGGADAFPQAANRSFGRAVVGIFGLDEIADLRRSVRAGDVAADGLVSV